MADTKSLHSTPPVEGDGVSYSGIVWFVVILTLTTIACQLLVWGMFEIMDARNVRADAGAAPMAAPATPVPDSISMEKYLAQAAHRPPAPNLLTDEPVNLREFRRREDLALTTYGWADKTTETVRLPIARAKELLLERGSLSIRPAAEPAAPGAKPAGR